MEIWTNIKDVPGYEVSSEGRIRNSKTGRIMKTPVNSKGYKVIALRNNSMRNHYSQKSVHRLVADNFYDGDHTDLDVNHIDGNKLNNHISNLEFCTRSENVSHAFRLGLKQPSRQKKVRVIETGKVFNSIRECGRVIGCDQSMICQCLNGKMRSCNGYHFEKVDV